MNEIDIKIEPNMQLDSPELSNYTVSISDFNEVCRTCLSRENVLKTFNELIEIHNYPEDLLNMIGVDLSNSSYLPQNICVNCINDLEHIKKFINRSKEIHNYLYNLVECAIKTESSEIVNDVEEECNEQIESNDDINQQLIPEQIFVPERQDEDWYNEEASNYEEEDPISSTSNVKRRTMHGKKNTKANDKDANQTKAFVCNTCGKAFNLNYYLKRHMMIHTGEKPFICDVCGKSFNQKVVLTAHKRIHQNKKTKKNNALSKFKTYKSANYLDPTIVRKERKKKTIKQWIYDRKFKNAMEAEDLVKSERKWGYHYSNVTKAGTKRIYRCNQVKSRGLQCNAGISLFFTRGCIILYRSQLEHTCNFIETKARSFIEESVNNCTTNE